MTSNKYSKDDLHFYLSEFGNFLRDNYQFSGAPELLPYKTSVHPKGTVDDILDWWIGEFIDKPIVLYSENTPTLSKKICNCGIYAIGELESKIGFDLLGAPYISVDNGNFVLAIKEGEQAVKVQHKGESIDAVLFYWKHQNSHKTIHRGLVCLVSDTDSYKMAKAKYKARAKFL